jgi:hypothetical protein
MQTVWMQRWSRAAHAERAQSQAFKPGRPPYVDRRVCSLLELLRSA